MKLSSQETILWRPAILLTAVVLFFIPYLVAAEADNQAGRLDVEKITQLRNSEVKALKNMEMQQLSERMRQVQGFHNQLKGRVHKRNPVTPTVANPFNTIDLEPITRSSTRTLPGELDIKVNGADADTITQGEDIVLTIDFSTGSNSADMQLWIDMDGDGLLDPDVDMAVDDAEHFLDNDYDDEDRTFGRYQITFYGNDDGPNQVGDIGILFEAMDTSGYDIAYQYIEPLNGPYSVSGIITPPTANIIVIAANMDSISDDDDDMDMWMTLTDSLGNYQNFVPIVGNYALMAEDFLNVTDGMYADTGYFDIFVDGHLTGYDFNFITPTAAIEGYVEDEFGTAIEDIYVWADEEWGDGPGRQAETDSNGYYFMNVEEGEYWVGIDGEDLIPDYMVPRDSMIYVPDNDTVGLDFEVYSTDGFISGMVYLNDMPFEGALVSADGRLGWTESYSGSDGYYELSVSSQADAMGGYHINIRDWDELPPGTVQLNWHGNVMTGSDTIDIYLATFDGGIEGRVYDDMGNPIWAWIQVQNEFEHFNWGTDHEGNFYLPLPNGDYEVIVGSDGFYTTYDSIYIMDDFIYREYWLQPMTIDGSISGFVYNQNDGSPLHGAVVEIGNEFYWDQTFTDPSGYYHFGVPYGVYGGWAWMEGFADAGPDSALVVNPSMPDIQYDYHLHPFTVDAAIGGVVVDGEFQTPLGGANVHLQGNYFGIDEMTGPDGHFYFEVPSDIYWLDAWAPGYHHSDMYEVFVETDSSIWVTIELWPQEFMPPMLHTVEDIPNDQGRQVRLAWSPGIPPPGQNWTHFSVWRQVDDWLWDFIAAVPYHGDMDYAYVAPTLVDSNHVTGPTGDFWSTFLISGHAFNPWEFYDSNWHSGYSVDNLLPHVPIGLMASANDGGGIALNWQPVPDADFEYFAVYRGAVAGFEPGEVYAYTIDTAFVDLEAGIGDTYYYLVSATDFNGNESGYSAEVNMTLLTVDEVAVIPEEFDLAQNYPNPFNPSTVIEYALPEAGQVTVTVYNILGVEVATLVNDFQVAGRYIIQWQAGDLASGLYLVQMRSADFTQTRKVMLMK